MNYTEKDLRLAFQAGMDKGSHRSFFDAPLNENEYINSLTEETKEEEKNVPITFY